MTSLQKIIKYGAVAFGIYLCLMIISVIVFTITGIFGITAGIGWFHDSHDATKITKWEQEYSAINNLDIDLSVCQLMIQKGETLKVDVSDVSQQFQCKVEGDTLIIEDKEWKKSIFDWQEIKPQVMIFVPENIAFNEVNIKTGVNETKIEYLEANKIDLEMGVGKYQIDEILAKSLKIKAGVGEANIDYAKVEEMKLEGGVGKLSLTSKVMKKAEINCGMGKVDWQLIGNKNDYQIKAETGLGQLIIDHQKISENETLGKGEVSIKIEAGIGETIVDFKAEEIKR